MSNMDPNTAILNEYCWEDIEKHNTEESCWIVVDNRVYDVTCFLDQHPGGREILLGVAGQDASEEFHEVPFHTSGRTAGFIWDYLIGDVAEKTVEKPGAKQAYFMEREVDAMEGSAEISSNSHSPLKLVILVVIFAILYKLSFAE